MHTKTAHGVSKSLKKETSAQLCSNSKEEMEIAERTVRYYFWGLCIAFIWQQKKLMEGHKQYINGGASARSEGRSTCKRKAQVCRD